MASLFYVKSAYIIISPKWRTVCFSSFGRQISVTCSQLQWKKPTGYDAGVKVFNSEIREKVPLILRRKGIASWYMCGPTVYADAHIGHASCYVKFDIIRRILEKFFNIDVVLHMGVTDIDDKIINRAQNEECKVEDIAKKYEKDFFADLQAMDVLPPTIVTRVTEFIPQIIAFCQTLVDKDFAYVTKEGNVYFIVSKVSTENIVEEGVESSQFHRVVDPLKRDQRDFALWKSAKAGEPSWSSPWGEGRPGWHIECSCMATHCFGAHIDIHTGGMDLAFPHHANERSQSQCYHDNDQWVNYWIHVGLLQLEDDIKMSKSIGNTLSIKDFLKASSANVFRILCIQGLYRHNVTFSKEALMLAQNVYRKLHTFLKDAESYTSGELVCQPFSDMELENVFQGTKEAVHSALADDFSTSQALAQILTLVGETSRVLQPSVEKSPLQNLELISAITSYVDRTLDMLGVNILCKRKLPLMYVQFINTIISFRNEVRSYARTVRSEHTEVDVPQTLVLSVQRELAHFGICLDVESGWSVEGNVMKHSLDSVILCQDLRQIMDSVLAFSKTVLTAVQEHSTAKQILENASSEQRTCLTEMEQRRRAVSNTLLKASDDFRSELMIAKIGIKDMKYSSIWFPMEPI